MRVSAFLKRSTTLSLFVLLCLPLLVFAQPNPDRLADMMAEKNSSYLANIDRISISMEMDGLPIGAMSTMLEKRTENGFSWLAVTSDDSDFDSGINSGLMDDQAIKLVRAAESVTEETFAGVRTYKLTVSDPEVLQGIMEQNMDFGMDEDMFEFTPERITMWIDREMLVPRKVYFEQRGGDGNPMNVEMVMDEYQIHDGLPIAHSVQLSIEGLENQFSESELQEARRMMEQMESQLQNMPESQRAMIQDQLRPQLERFEEMLNSGGMSMVMRIRDVQVNP